MSDIRLCNRLANAALNLLYPPACIFCGEFINDGREIIICDRCAAKIPYLKQTEHVMPELSFEKLFTLFRYGGQAEEFIKRFKYHNHFEYAKPIAHLMARHIGRAFPSETDFIVPVPLHKARFKKRGFNQSEILATELSKHYGIPVENGALKRIKNTLPQFNLSPRERLENINGAFAVENADIVKNKVILLADDICTTGSTLESCSRALLYSGARAVYCITIALT